jgi:hypothetical protein
LGCKKKQTQETMPDQDLQLGNDESEAPPRLVEALRRLPQPVLLVPPQIDAAALSRPRLHLARVREMQGLGPELEAYRLDLAARAGEAGAAPVGQLLPRPKIEVRRTPKAWWYLTWKLLALAAMLAVALWLSREWHRHGGIQPAVKIQHKKTP